MMGVDAILKWGSIISSLRQHHEAFQRKRTRCLGQSMITQAEVISNHDHGPRPDSHPCWNKSPI